MSDLSLFLPLSLVAAAFTLGVVAVVIVLRVAMARSISRSQRAAPMSSLADDHGHPPADPA